MNITHPIKLDNGHTWAVEANTLLLRPKQPFRYDALGPSVIVPISELGNMTEQEIGKTVKALIWDAEVTRARLLVSQEAYHITEKTPASRLYSLRNLISPYQGYHESIDAMLNWIADILEEQERQELTKQRKRELTRQRRNQFKLTRPDLELAIIDRDGYVCAICGTQEDLTVDHIVPLSKGGTDDLDNLQLLCRTHNSQKGDTQ